MMLETLIKNIPNCKIQGNPNVKILGITQDSRRVAKGFLFVAIPGNKLDGSLFVADAVRRGASAVVLNPAGRLSSLSVPQVVVDDPRLALAQASARFYGDPSLRMTVIGITGTNGKTTLTYLLESILREAGRRPAVLGTVNYRFGDKIYPAENTTPESVDLQRFFHETLRQGATDVIMEVSSHALSMGRIEGIHFDVGVFTNLSQDHLDYHKDMEDYFQAKLKLFTIHLPQSRKKRKWVVLNGDDPRSLLIARSLLAERTAKGSSLQIARTGLTAEPSFDVYPSSYQLTSEGLTATLRSGQSTFEVRSSLTGRFNLENILAAVGVAHSLGISGEAIVRGIQRLSAVPGRLERITNDRGFDVFVDYAHTPDALEKAGETLKALKTNPASRLITVFGCGGDRDRTKRPLMGAKAAGFSDVVILTSDNPRSEDPEAIIDEIASGMKGFTRDRLFRVTSRREALRKAIQMARPGDVVLVAGKGHEDYQVIGSAKIHFSDQEILREMLGKFLNEINHQ